MKTIYLVGCGKKKLACMAPAAQLYTGDLFRKSLAYAEAQEPDAVYILSAHYNLVRPTDYLRPYDVALYDLGVHERCLWGNSVAAGLQTYGHHPRRAHIVILAGRAYIEPLERHLRTWDAPLAGMGIGERLAWLTRELARMERGRAAA